MTRRDRLIDWLLIPVYAALVVAAVTLWVLDVAATRIPFEELFDF